MSKPNVSTELVSARLSAVSNNLKECEEWLDAILAEPYIPSIRTNQLAHCIDKVQNLQENIHQLRLQLSHLG
jgi:hypothetical protein